MGALTSLQTPELDHMDEDTRQLLNALEKSLETSLRLQLSPMERQLETILSELSHHREGNQRMAITVAVLEERMVDQKSDLNKGLFAVRGELKVAMNDRTKVLGQAFAALATITAILIGLATWYLKGGR